MIEKNFNSALWQKKKISIVTNSGRFSLIFHRFFSFIFLSILVKFCSFLSRSIQFDSRFLYICRFSLLDFFNALVRHWFWSMSRAALNNCYNYDIKKEKANFWVLSEALKCSNTSKCHINLLALTCVSKCHFQFSFFFLL